MGIFFLGALLQNTAPTPVHHVEAPIEESPDVSMVETKINRTNPPKEIAFTFDADMTPHMLEMRQEGIVQDWYDKKVVDTLVKNDIPATFFITGLWAETYPNLVREFSENKNFEIGNHSYDHAGFTKPCYNLTPAHDKKEEIEKTQKILASLTEKIPKLFRFPGGCHSAADVSLAHSLGVTTVNWDVISGDSYYQDPDKIAEKILAEVKDGSIIVMHVSGGPFAPASGEALVKVIPVLQDRGYIFKTASNLIRDFQPEVLK